MFEDTNTEIDIFEDDFGLLVAEGQIRDIADELEELHYRRGSHFIWQLKVITSHPSFYPIKGEDNIYTTGGESGEDYENLLNAARKAVEHGYRVFILPNPKGIRTADFIFERKGVYKMFDLKTIIGKSSVGNRLLESIGQSNRVLLNMPTGYNTRLLAADIKTYFELNEDALEVMILKGRKLLSIDRNDVLHPSYYRIIKKRFEK
jgi:hypothetical protein